MDPVRWKQAQQLFELACALTPAARAEYVATACGEDLELRRLVESLLAARTEAGADASGFLAGVIGGAVNALDPAAGAGWGPGHRVGPYRIVRELGRGGMGAVYLAERDDDVFRARVAIKVVPAGAFAAELLRRFAAERQILATLDHPNIARILDGGRTPEGAPYLVMEYVDGEQIDAYCERHGLGTRQRIELFRTVCAAVQHAHRHLIVHRDLKPSNILVTPEGVPKLLDFGIAKLLAPADAMQATTSHLLMTPSYASPEQVRGEAITTASDVYALGLLLYELLTGRRAHRFADNSAAEIHRVICETEPERPSIAALGGARDRAADAPAAGREAPRPAAAAGRAGVPRTRLRRELAGDLDAILLRALRKEPAQRYTSVEQFSDDLRRHLASRPVLARPATWRYRVSRFARRNRVPFAAAAAGLILLAGITAAFTARLAAERNHARLEAEKASQVAAFLQELFEVSDPSQSRGRTVTAREMLDSGAARVERELAEQPAVRAAMMRVIGDVYARLGLHEEARPLLEEALRQHRALHGDEHEEVAESETALAVLLQDMGDVAAAEPLFRHALATRQRLFGPEDVKVSESLGHLSYLLETNGDYAGAEQLARQAFVMNRKLLPPEDPRVARSMVKLGGLLRRLGEEDEAETLLREGLALERRIYGGKHPAVAGTIRNLAALLRDKGAYDESEALYREALAIRREVLGPEHPEVATTLNSYAILLHDKGDLDAAIAAYREVLELWQRIYQGPHPDQAATYSNLAQVLRDAGRTDEAAAMYRASIRVQDQVLAETHPNRAFPLIGLARLYMDQRRYAEAEPLLREALALRRAALEEGHRYIGDALSDLGACLAALRRFAEAEPLLLEAHRLFVAGEGEDDSRTRRARRRLFELYQAWGRPDQAAPYQAPGAGG